MTVYKKACWIYILLTKEQNSENISIKFCRNKTVFHEWNENEDETRNERTVKTMDWSQNGMIILVFLASAWDFL